MKIIEALKAGKITYEQAVQILVLTLEFEDATARELLGAPEDYEKPEPDPVEAPESNAEDETDEDEQTDEETEETPEDEESDDESDPQEPEPDSKEKELDSQATPGPDINKERG